MINALHDGRAPFKKFDVIFAIECKAYAVASARRLVAD